MNLTAPADTPSSEPSPTEAATDVRASVIATHLSERRSRAGKRIAYRGADPVLTAANLAACGQILAAVELAVAWSTPDQGPHAGTIVATPSIAHTLATLIGSHPEHVTRALNELAAAGRLVRLRPDGDRWALATP